MDSIENIIIDRVMNVLEIRLDEKLDEIRRDVGRRMLHTIVDAAELADILDMSAESIRRKRNKGELPYSLHQGNYMYDLRKIRDHAHECNFKNVLKVRQAIDEWMDSRVSELLD